jgi:hypothetical protein
VCAERLHVVTVPHSPSSSSELWERFATAVEVPPSAAQAPPKRTNQSLGFASTELLRQVNSVLGKHRRTEYNRVIKDYLAAKVLTQLAAEEAPAEIDAETSAFASRWNERAIAAISASGAHVVGDLSDLPTTGSLQPASTTTAAGDAELLRAAVVAQDALERLVRRLSRRRGARAPARDGFPDAGFPDERDLADPSPTDAVPRVARLAEQAIQLRRQLQGPPRGRRR